MKLYIDTSSSESIVVGVDGEMFETEAKKKIRQLTDQRLLPFIIEVLGKKNKTMKDITEIEVNTGPGSFTGIRVGASVAQALGWHLGVLVNGKNLKNGECLNLTY